MYPIMLNIKDRTVVVVGGGKIAARKIKELLREEANIIVISPTLHLLIPLDKITWINRCYQTGDLNQAFLAFACTDNAEVNAQIINEALPHQLVNNVGDKKNSDFYNMAITRHGDFSISISTNGKSPQQARQLREKLEQFLSHTD